jgi:hypothetical protein
MEFLTPQAIADQYLHRLEWPLTMRRCGDMDKCVFLLLVLFL